MKVGLLCFGYENFKCEVAAERYERTVNLLKDRYYEVVYNDSVIVDPMETEKALDKMQNENVDAYIVQNGTFSDGNHIIKIIEKVGDKPLILWGFPEPKAGEYDFIAINSMTAFNMFTSYLYKYNKKFAYIFGNIETVQDELFANLKAIKALSKIKKSKFCIIGGRAPGFYLSPVDELKFRKTFGVEIVYYSLAELIKDCTEMDSEKVEIEKKNFLKLTNKFTASDEGLEKAARMYLALKDLCTRDEINGLSLKCWPEMQSVYNFAPCAVNGRLVSEGLMVSCEGDVTGLMTMYVQSILAEESVFFTDLVNLNENGSFKFWHCGCAPTVLAHKKEETEFIDQPTLPIKLGLATAFELKRDVATVCKLKEDENGYKLFIARGKSIEADRKVTGNQSDILFEADGRSVIDSIVRNGIEHHYSVAYKDIVEVLKAFCYFTNVETIIPH